jgi:predicted GIY-YIG superfamily endonuclease
MRHGGFVYMVTNQYNTVLYVGVTSELRQGYLNTKQNFILKALLQI